MDHPCFFDCFHSGHAGDDFRIRGVLFYLSEFGDTAFALHSGFFVFGLSGMERCSKPVP